MLKRVLDGWVKSGEARQDKALKDWQSIGQLQAVKVNEPAGINMRWFYDLPTYRYTETNGQDTLYVPSGVSVSGAADYDAYESSLWWKVDYKSIAYPGVVQQGGGQQGPPQQQGGGGRPPVAPAYRTPGDLEQGILQLPHAPGGLQTPANPRAVVTAAEGERWYQAGYTDARNSVTPRADLGWVLDAMRTAPVGTPAYHYGQGYAAGTAEKNAGAPPVGQQPPFQLPGLPPLDPNIGYELYGSVPIFGGEPYNWVRFADSMGIPVRYQLKGFTPAQYRQGFRLSGPTGRAIQLARQEYGNVTPQSVGLPGWIAVVDSSLGRGRTVRLLDADEIRDIAEEIEPVRARY